MLIWERQQQMGPLRDIFGVGAAVQGGSQIAGAAIQANAINNATNAQKEAANNTLGFQKDVFNTQQQNIAPYLDVGRQSLNALGYGSNFIGTPYGSLTSEYPGGDFQGQYQGQNFNPDSIVRNPDANLSYQGQAFNQPDTQTAQFDPSSINLQQDPGYQFRLDQGMQALQRSQAATGISGGAAAKAIAEYSQGVASQEYGNAYQRALAASQQNTGINQQNFQQQLQGYNANQQNAMNQFQTGAQGYQLNSANHQQWIQNAAAANQANNANALNQYNTGLQNYNTNYNRFATHQGDVFNRLAALAGIGQAGVNQLSAAGNNAAQGVANANAAAGNAASAGSAAMGNVWSNMASGLGNTFGQYQMMRGLGMTGRGNAMGGATGGGIFDEAGSYIGE
jgi:hypothetical protein